MDGRYLIELFPSDHPFSIEHFENGQPVTAEAWWSSGEQPLPVEFLHYQPAENWTFWNRQGEIIGSITYRSTPPKVFVWDSTQMNSLEHDNWFYADIYALIKETIGTR